MPFLRLRISRACGVAAALGLATVCASPAQPVSFHAARAHGVAGLAASVAAADLNGDGKPDLAVACGAGDAAGLVAILFGNGADGFLSAGRYPVGVTPSGIANGDFKGDG